MLTTTAGDDVAGAGGGGKGTQRGEEEEEEEGAFLALCVPETENGDLFSSPLALSFSLLLPSYYYYILVY